LAFVLFVLAVAAGHGLDWLCGWVKQTRLPGFATFLAWMIPLLIMAELAVMGWRLFDDIFVCKPTISRLSKEQEFATRVRTTAHRDPRMMSCLYPFLMSNTGVLEGYENLAVPRGRVFLEGKPGYRGECFLEENHGRAEIREWSMNRVKVSLSAESSDRLVLNQNYDAGWRAVVSGDQGVRRVNASKSSEGLISTPVLPGDRFVEFRYLPSSFVWGAWMSGVSLLICGVFWIAPWSWFRRTKPQPEQNTAAQGLPQ
jgi:hypothetical protein